MTTWQFRAVALMSALVPGVIAQPRELQFNRNLLAFPKPATCSIDPPPRIIPMTPGPTMDIPEMDSNPTTDSPTYSPTDSPTLGPTEAPSLGPTKAPSRRPTDAPSEPVSTCPYYSVDFSGYAKGDWITDQYRLSHSLIINVEKNADKPNCNKYSSMAGSIDSHGLMAARVFDTAHPGPCYQVNGKDQGCDPDLGAPHSNCAKYGYAGAGDGTLYPGHGDGGDPDKQTNSAYINCVPQGNVLIIDEGWNTPDDSGCGGVIQFSFTQPADIGTLGLLDIDDDKPVRITVEDTDGVVHERNSPLDVGDNGMYEMVVGVTSAVTLRVHFDSSGSVSYINYHLCPDPRRYDSPDFTSENSCETALVYCEPAYRREWCGANTPAGLPNRWGWSNMVNTANTCYIGAGMDGCDTNVGSVAGTVDIDYLNNQFKVTVANGWTLYAANFIAGPELDQQVSSAWSGYPLGYDGFGSNGKGPGLHVFDYTDGMDINDFMVGHMIVCADGVDPYNGINDGNAQFDLPSAETLLISRDFEDFGQAEEWSNFRWSGAKTSSATKHPIKSPMDLTQTTNFLGFFGKEKGGSWGSYDAKLKMSNTFSGLGSPAALKIQFDLVTLDDWEYGDKASVKIRDKKFWLGEYNQDNSAAAARNKEPGCTANTAACDIEGWKPNGASSSESALVSVTHFLGSNGQGLALGLRDKPDAAHRFEMIVPPYYFPNGELFMEFEVTLNSKVDNEAGAIDNIHIYGLSSMPAPGTRRLL